MKLENYKTDLLRKIINNEPLSEYRVITDYKHKNKNEGTFAVVRYVSTRQITICKGSLIKPIESYHKVAGVYYDVCDSAKRVYGKGNLVHRNSIKVERIVIEGVEYDKVLEDYEGISMFGAITISTITHGDNRLVYKVNKDAYIDKYKLTSKRYLGAIVHEGLTIYGKVTEQGIISNDGEMIDINTLYKESVQCGIYRIINVYRRIA